MFPQSGGFPCYFKPHLFWSLGYFIGWSSRSEQKPAASPPCWVAAPTDDRFQLESQGEASACSLLGYCSFFPQHWYFQWSWVVKCSATFFPSLFFAFCIYSNLIPDSLCFWLPFQFHVHNSLSVVYSSEFRILIQRTFILSCWTHCRRVTHFWVWGIALFLWILGQAE